MDLNYILNTMLICCWIWPGLAHSDRGDCIKANAKSCAECIQAGKNCGWCTLAEFLRKGELTVTRCDDIESLKMRGCPIEDIENPKGSLRVESDRNLTDLASGMKTNVDDLIQIQPQKLSLKLRSGETQSFSLHFQKAKEYPMDLYYLADLSLSVQDGLENMKKLAIELNEEMRKITSDFRIGFGVLQKNPCTAGETCRSQFSFRNVLPLNSDGATFSTLLHNQAIAASLNSSEDGADAIMQTAVCGATIGWRNAIRLLVYYSNTGLHFSRDGKLSSMRPNDGKCHVDSQGVYTMNHHQNHPSISHLARKLEKNQIQLLFAVKEELKDIYQTIQDSIPKSEVGILTSNSSNVIKLTLNAFQASEVILENSKLPAGVSIHYTAHCKNNTIHTGEDGRKCSGIQVGDEVNFAISIKAEKCPNKGQKTTINIKPRGLNEKVKIDLEFVCECECQKNATTNSPDCHQGNGMLECGACRCKEGRIGPFCECSADEVFSEDMEASCRKDNASPICSNNGDCICGECVCKKRENPSEKFSGQYCQCDNFSCDRFNGLICGGNGICHCGECVCLPTFTGNACHCSLDMEACESTNGQICNGRGTCECGRCRCTDSGFSGPTCEQCPTCPGVCVVYKNCALCKAFNKGPKKDTCDQCEFEVTLVEHLDQLAQQHCRFKDMDNSWFCFSYSINDQEVPEVHVVKTQDSC